MARLPVAFALLVLVGISFSSSAYCEQYSNNKVHLRLQSGFYASLGSPSPWGNTLSLDVLPTFLTGRHGVRLEWRRYRLESQGSYIFSYLYEAGSSRPQLVATVVGEVGLTSKGKALLGSGVQWSVGLWGPLGFSTLTDLQILVDGKHTRPALAINFNLHLGF